MWEIYQWECRPLLWHQERWCVKCDLQRGINQLCGHKSTGMGFSWVSLPERNGEKTTASCENGCVRWSACRTERMVKFFFFWSYQRGGVSTSPQLLRMNHLPHIFCSGCSQTSPWSPTVKSCWGVRGGGWGQDRRGQERRGKRPSAPASHSKRRREKKERDHRIDFN